MFEQANSWKLKSVTRTNPIVAFRLFRQHIWVIIYNWLLDFHVFWLGACAPEEGCVQFLFPYAPSPLSKFWQWRSVLLSSPIRSSSLFRIPNVSFKSCMLMTLTSSKYFLEANLFRSKVTPEKIARLNFEEYEISGKQKRSLAAQLSQKIKIYYWCIFHFHRVVRIRWIQTSFMGHKWWCHAPQCFECFNNFGFLDHLFVLATTKCRICHRAANLQNSLHK